MQFSKRKEITFPQDFIFVFIPYFIGVILSNKCCQKGGLGWTENIWGIYRKSWSLLHTMPIIMKNWSWKLHFSRLCLTSYYQQNILCVLKGWLVSLSKRFSYSIAWIIETIKVKMSSDAKEKEIKRDEGIFEWDEVYIPHKN